MDDLISRSATKTANATSSATWFSLCFQQLGKKGSGVAIYERLFLGFTHILTNLRFPSCPSWFESSAMKNDDLFLSAMNKYFVFNNLCGKAAGTVIFKKAVFQAILTTLSA